LKIVDANVLLYAVNHDSAHHDAARGWLDDALTADEAVGFAWMVVLAFLRISTHPAVFPTPLTPAQAFEVVNAWLSQPNAVYSTPSTRHLGLLGGLVHKAGSAGNLINDAHLAALAVEHDAEVVSFDADFARFDVRLHRPA
jgi:toxin-antitoxin system PIN domain toxin